MPRYRIEVTHPVIKLARLQIAHLSHKTGSHYLSHCEWGCIEGEHRSWITVDVDSEKLALRIVPPMFRRSARVVPLQPFPGERLIRH